MTLDSAHAPVTAPASESTYLTVKGQRTRDAIVASAATLIHARGASATTLGDVRRVAKVSSSQLYHYFVDKQDLVRAVVDRQAEAVVESQQTMDLSTLDAFRQWRTTMVADEEARYGRGGCPLGSLGADLAETDPVGRERVAVGFQRWAQVIEIGLDRMQGDGELPQSSDTHRLAVGILAALQGGLLIGQVERSAAALDAALSNTIDLLEALSRQAGNDSPAERYRAASAFPPSIAGD
jgi:TetR/AcrR family transcriptional regulator, transcriptional repressor for nem operon